MPDDATDGAATDGARDADGDTDDDTVPTVELDLYQLSVSVSGRSDDDLAAVEGTARDLMGYLVDQAERLEEGGGGRGVS
ncbi:MAG: hypothetical protein ABEJ34_04395 [Haloferacaceae archaeon]